MASLGEHAEYEYLERILLDAISEKTIEYSSDADEDIHSHEKSAQYEKYQVKNYKPIPHEYRE